MSQLNHPQQLLSATTEERAIQLLAQSPSNSRRSWRSSRGHLSESAWSGTSSLRSGRLSLTSLGGRSSLCAGGDQVNSELYITKKRMQDAESELGRIKAEQELQIAESMHWKENRERDLQDNIVKIEKLEKDRRFLYERDIASGATIKQLEEKALQIERQTETAQLQLREQLRDLRDQYETLKTQHDTLYSLGQHKDTLYKQTIIELSNSDYDRQQEILRLSEENVALRQEADQLKGDMVTIRARYQLQESGDALNKDVAVSLAELKDQVGYIQGLEFRNNSLNQRIQRYELTQNNIMLIEEEKRALQQEVSKMNELQNILTQVMLENKLLKNERSEWSLFADEFGSIGFASPHDMARALANDRLKLTALQESYSRLTTDVEFKSKTIESLETQITQAKHKIKQLQENVYTEQFQRRRVEKFKELLVQETELLRMQLVSFENEYLLADPNLQSQHTTKIQDLEKLLELYKAENDAFVASTTISSLYHTVSTEQDSLNSSQEIDELTRERDLLQKELRELYQRNTESDQNMTDQHFDPRTTRILQLADNPDTHEHAVRLHYLKQLQTENNALLAQLSTHEVGDDDRPLGSKRQRADDLRKSNSGEPLMESVCRLQTEIKRLEEDLAIRKQRLANYQKVAKEQMLELQTVVRAILGYQLEPVSEGRYKIRSSFATLQDETVTFAIDREVDEVRVVQTGNDAFYNQFMRLFDSEDHIGRIPCVLARITLDLASTLHSS